MGLPAAARGDRVQAIDIHLIQSSAPSPFPVPHPFSGVLDGGLSTTVRIGGRHAATATSTATNTPKHVPIGGSFAIPPHDRALVVAGSATVRIGGLPAARAGDPASTCNDLVDLAVGRVVAAGAVRIGG